jgi:hypothetical protein
MSDAPLPNLPPAGQAPGPEGTFTETAKQIFARLNERKYLLLQRALLAVWPGLVTLAAAYAFWGNALANEESGGEIIWASIQARPHEGWIVGALLLASMVYGALANAVLSIERIIWVDSYFDGKNLSPAESLRVARRLFPSAVRLWVWSFFRYWLAPLAFLALAPIGLLFAWYAGSFVDVFGVVVILGVFIVFLVWSYLVTLRTRNLWFLFLDHHDGERADTATIPAELDRINRETKTKEFLKYVGSTVGVDSLAGLVKVIASLGAQASGASRVLDRTVLGQGVKMYGQALAAQAQSFARVIAAYVFYRAACQRLGLGQKVNERVYALARE